jgi:hypothetical protein
MMRDSPSPRLEEDAAAALEAVTLRKRGLARQDSDAGAAQVWLAALLEDRAGDGIVHGFISAALKPPRSVRALAFTPKSFEKKRQAMLRFRKPEFN